MSERPSKAYDAGAAPRDVGTRRYTEGPSGPLEVLVMAMAREMHDRERPGEDWFSLVGSSVTSWCRLAVQERGLNWPWVLRALERERLDEATEHQ